MTDIEQIMKRYSLSKTTKIELIKEYSHFSTVLILGTVFAVDKKIANVLINTCNK